MEPQYKGEPPRVLLRLYAAEWDLMTKSSWAIRDAKARSRDEMYTYGLLVHARGRIEDVKAQMKLA